MIPQTSSITVDQIPEEIQQFRFVIALIILSLDILADFFNQFKNLSLLEKHDLVVIIHLFEEVNTSYIFLDMMLHFRNMFLHYFFDLVEVFNQRNDEIIRHVK